MNDGDLRAYLDQAEASAVDTAPIVATMYKEFRKQGLDLIEAAFLAAAWIWVCGQPHPADNERG